MRHNIAIDLDAGRREQEYPDTLPVTFRGETFDLPAEFPLDVLDPFLAEDFNLAGLIREVMAEARKEDGTTKPISEVVIDTLFNRPALPIEVIQAIFAAFELLFGAENYARFKALRPSLVDYGRLTRGLFSAYGVSLGEAFASPASSETAGTTPNQTSPGSTPDSTPDGSGADQGSSPGS